MPSAGPCIHEDSQDFSTLFIITLDCKLDAPDAITSILGVFCFRYIDEALIDIAINYYQIIRTFFIFKFYL